MVKAINEWEDLTEKLHNIFKQLSHEEGIVSLNVFIPYYFTCFTMKTELNVQPEFYSIFRAYHQGGVPLIWICFPL